MRDSCSCICRTRAWSVFFDALIAGGWDPGHGARLCGDMRAVGLVDVRADYVAGVDTGGSLIARLVALTLERLRERMVSLGATNEEVDEARRMLEDPSSTIMSPTTCVAQGRRPTDVRPERSGAQL
jgi:hypothetical protein